MSLLLNQPSKLCLGKPRTEESVSKTI
ncbi:BnaA10g08250D [Brassica napus]|uniref:BnaA10g08250D protein n=1 Tax=Brassica napus TaxID=3708 RepID=A0A078HYP3_BRANA|nr:BnaA10g08250D [Brassica napus]